MLDYLEAAKADTGVDVVCTSTTDHPLKSASGNVSNHRKPGTGGEGLALDFRLRRRGTAPNAHRAAYNLVLPVANQAQELIYKGAPCYRNEKPAVYSQAVLDQHDDHCHWAVDLGRIVRWPTSTPTVPPAQPSEGRRMWAGPAIDPTSGGEWWVRLFDGAVYTSGGAPYLGALNQHPEYKATERDAPGDAQVAGISTVDYPAGSDKWGYRITSWLRGDDRLHDYDFPRV